MPAIYYIINRQATFYDHQSGRRCIYIYGELPCAIKYYCRSINAGVINSCKRCRYFLLFCGQLAFLTVFKMVPETKGRTLEEMEGMAGALRD